MVDPKVKAIADRYVEINSSLNRKFSNLVRIAAGDQLTVEQYATLAHIHRAGSSTSTELAAEFGVKKSAITSIINRLFEKEWVRRTNDPKDRRTIHLTLTDDGRSIFEAVDYRIQSLIQPVINEFEEEEIQTFLNNLQRLDIAIGRITKDKEGHRE